jgi:hypothetical protein
VTRSAVTLLAATLLAGCASVIDAKLPVLVGAEVVSCTQWFERLDGAIDQHNVRDAEADRITGFAGLRVDRLSASLRDRASTDSAAFEVWLAQLQKLGNDGRAVEIGNLPRGAFPIDDATDAAQARAKSQRCIDAWRAPLLQSAELREILLARAEVPSRYVDWQRAAGLYPILRWPFLAGVRSWERDHTALVARWAASPPPLQRYAPPPMPMPSADMARWWRERPRNAFGLPQFTAAEMATLLLAYAPAIEIESRDNHDRFGALVWRNGVPPAVDSGVPVVYQRVAATRYRGRLLLQLVYSLWFPERPAQGGFDLLAGALDAVVLRITLAPDDGRPLLVDSIHGCGCYHLFMPTTEARLRDDGPRNVEWAYAPITLPAMRPGERIVVRFTSASHYVVGSAPDDGASGTPYALRDDNELRQLPLPQSGARSIFGADGLVAGSERAERFLFWPMGIASPGEMRQWGHHATAFVGRRHFDDADLIEARFVLLPLELP